MDEPSSQIAPDGSPVEVYRTLPPMGEPEIIHAAVPTGCDILELGCGAGRVTHALLALGHRVTGVDNSPEMLRHVRGAIGILADAATFEPARRFAAVVLASSLVNTADPALRRQLLDTCARAVEPDGVVLVERLDPAGPWEPGAVREGEIGGVAGVTRVLARAGDVVTATTEYRIGRRAWRQDYVVAVLDEEAMRIALGTSGLELERWLDPRQKWLLARPKRRARPPK